ncbi:short chain dehydrogenase family protein (plasmid) [Sphingobium sp. RAC03]|nr:short chain dehydrogenase family protein [Sphingobium sp. RAC03]
MTADWSEPHLLTGRIVIVTGGGSGIGRAAAQLAAGRGAHVVVTDVNDSVHDVAAALRADGLAATGATLDVADRSAVDTLFDEVAAEHGRIDGLVTSAGIMQDGPAADIAEDALDRIFGINLRGTLSFCCPAAVGRDHPTGPRPRHREKWWQRSSRANVGASIPWRFPRSASPSRRSSASG